MAKLVLTTFRRPPPHIPGYFWKRKIFSPFSKNTHPYVAYSNRFSPPTWKQHSISYGACVMLEVYDVWHRRIRKPPVSSVHTQTKSRRFQKSLLWRVFFEKIRFQWLFLSDTWAVGQNRRKNISFQTKTDMSGWGGALSCIMLEAKAWLTVEMMITSLSCPWNSSTDPTFTSPNPKRSNKRRSFSTYELNKTTKTKNRN